MIRVHSDGIDLRLSHRFDTGWWVREARTSRTIGTIRRGGSHWWWMTWPEQPGPYRPERTRQAACDALVAWCREHDPALFDSATCRQ